MYDFIPWDHLITRQLTPIADRSLSDFSKANDAGHWPANSTCQFLHHQSRQNHIGQQHMPNGDSPLQVSL